MENGKSSDAISIFLFVTACKIKAKKTQEKGDNVSSNSIV
jgi:hypothetical protein